MTQGPDRIWAWNTNLGRVQMGQWHFAETHGADLYIREDLCIHSETLEDVRAALSAIIIESGGKAIPNESLTVCRNRALAALAKLDTARAQGKEG